MSTYGIVVCGQSNEQGGAAYASGGINVAFNSPFGFPNNDFLGDGNKGANAWGGRASMWPIVSQLLAKRDIRTFFLNAAQGGTGLVHNWVGYCKTWTNDWGYPNRVGVWVLPTTPNGKKYKCIVSGNYSTTEPVWPTTVGATIDELVTTPARWQCYTADGNDINGAVYTSSQSGYDPNGYIATLKARINALPAGCDQKWCFIAGNQSDLVYGSRYVTASVRSTALINLVNDLLVTFPTLNIALGMTSYWNSGFEGNSPSLSYETVLMPSLSQTLTYFAGNPRVIAGGDSFTALGKSPAYVSGDSPANIHIGVEATQASAQAWYNALVASGRF